MKPLLSLATRYLRAWTTNYKTTITGTLIIAHGVTTILCHLHAITEGTSDINPEQLRIAYNEIMAGAEFIAARDADKSSLDKSVGP